MERVMLDPVLVGGREGDGAVGWETYTKEMGSSVDMSRILDLSCGEKALERSWICSGVAWHRDGYGAF